MSDRDFGALVAGLNASGRFACVGLDTDARKLPDSLRLFEDDLPQAVFNRGIINAVQGIPGYFKLNLAYYLREGIDGLAALNVTIAYIHAVSPAAVVILDGKFGDIGSTSAAYAEFAFDQMGADAVTVNPYLGRDAMKPFLDRGDRGVFVLSRTSNPEAGQFQDLIVVPDEAFSYQATPLYLRVAGTVAERWNVKGNCGLVVGATYPRELAEVRQTVGDGVPILVPGVGAQGGDLAAAVMAVADSSAAGFIVNSSRAILYASTGPDWAEAAAQQTQALHDGIYGILNLV